MDELAILLLNWNGHEDTVECIKSIRENEEQQYKIFLLDNGSKAESVEFLEKWFLNEYQYKATILSESGFAELKDYSGSDLYFIKGHSNLGFAKGNNVMWSKLKSSFSYVLLLNNDTVIEPQSISKLVSYMDKNPEVGAVSCDIRFYSDRTKLWNAGGYFTWYGDRKYFSQTHIDELKKKGTESIRTPFVTGCCLLVRKSISESIGIFTEDFFFGEEDFNYCLRLEKAGIQVETILDSTIYHKVGTSIRKNQKGINSYILHFSNRIINQKKFKSKANWLIWKKFYLGAVYLKVLQLSKSRDTANKALKYIGYYTDKYDCIDYKTFLEINAIK